MDREKERNIEQYLSTNDLMSMLDISRSTVYRLMDRGMPSIKVGFENLMDTGIPRWLVARITAADIRDSEKAGRGSVLRRGLENSLNYLVDYLILSRFS